jgi:protein-disulfide isomerase
LASSENFTTENLADFGLDSPAYTLVMTAADSTTYTLLVGNKAPANPRYYALLNDDTSTVYVVQQTQVSQLTNLIATPPYVPPPTATVTFTPSPNPYSEVEQTATAVVEQTATTGAIFAQMTAEATGEVTAEVEATEEATEENVAETTEEATVVMQAEPTEEATEAPTTEPTVEETEEVMEEATEEASPTPAPTSTHTRTPAPTRPPTSTPTPTETPTPTNTPEPLPTSIAADSERRYGRIPQNVSEEGFPQLGEPDAAVQLTLYSSFDSPDSREFHTDVLLSLIDRVRSGQILVTFVPLYGTGNISNGERAARAAICAAQQDAFWVMSDILFDRQGTLRNQAFTNASLGDTAAVVGVDEAEWQECLDSDLPGEVLAAAQASADAQSVDDTPTVLVDGEPVDADIDSINTAIDAAMQSP